MKPLQLLLSLLLLAATVALVPRAEAQQGMYFPMAYDGFVPVGVIQVQNQIFYVVLDTGSSNLYLPAADCMQSATPGGNFTTPCGCSSAVQTADSEVPCPSNGVANTYACPGGGASACFPNMGSGCVCSSSGLAVDQVCYGLGNVGMAGNVIQETVTLLGDLPSATLSASVYFTSYSQMVGQFACLQTGYLRSGIMGLAFQSINTLGAQPFLTALWSQNPQMPQIFAMCINQPTAGTGLPVGQGGTFAVGTDGRAQLAAGGAAAAVLWTPIVMETSYAVSVVDIQLLAAPGGPLLYSVVQNGKMTKTQLNIPAAIVDSGTSTLQLPMTAYNLLVQQPGFPVGETVASLAGLPTIAVVLNAGKCAAITAPTFLQGTFMGVKEFLNGYEVSFFFADSLDAATGGSLGLGSGSGWLVFAASAQTCPQFTAGTISVCPAAAVAYLPGPFVDLADHAVTLNFILLVPGERGKPLPISLAPCSGFKAGPAITLAIPPAAYTLYDAAANQYFIRVMPSGKNLILGDPLFFSYLTIFDIANNRVGFTPAGNCNNISSEPGRRAGGRGKCGRG
eukprot:m.56541 g.56541  ORF g.56541 m.56541 type:complete len:564 (+) comp13396_c0_seq1:131-1822(+)